MKVQDRGGGRIRPLIVIFGLKKTQLSLYYLHHKRKIYPLCEKYKNKENKRVFFLNNKHILSCGVSFLKFLLLFFFFIFVD